MNAVTSITPETSKRLADVKIKAESSPEGSRFFIQLSYYPIVSLQVITGVNRDDGDQKKCIHLEYVFEPSDVYPKLNLSVEKPETIGYIKYRTLNLKEELELTFEDYKLKFNSVTDEINRSICKYHGIKTYEDGNETNQVVSNIIILHICDVMNILVEKEKTTVPEVNLITSLLKTIETKLSNQLTFNFISESNRTFFMAHIDYLYMCYGYYGNTSFVPIRTKIDINSDVFSESCMFANNRHFLKHQEGKLMELNETEQKEVTRMVYRSI